MNTTLSNAPRSTLHESDPFSGPRTLVIGLGNELLRDDAVGLHIARRLKAETSSQQSAVSGQQERDHRQQTSFDCGLSKSQTHDPKPKAQNPKSKIQDPKSVDVVETQCSGLGLIDLMRGYDRVIVIDAAKTGQRPVGEVTAADPREARASLPDAHRMGLGQAIAAATALGADLPPIELLTVEVADPFTLGEGLTPEVQQQMAEIVRRVRDWIARHSSADCR